MDLAITPDIYCPTIIKGDYSDYVPPVSKGGGLKCPCNGCNRVYASKDRFKTHTNSKGHKRWLANLNADRANHYKQLMEAEANMKTQRLIIAKLSQQVAELSLALATSKAHSTQESVDLISFD